MPSSAFPSVVGGPCSLSPPARPREGPQKCNVDTYAVVGWFRPPKISKDISSEKPIKEPRRRGEEIFLDSYTQFSCILMYKMRSVLRQPNMPRSSLLREVECIVTVDRYSHEPYL